MYNRTQKLLHFIILVSFIAQMMGMLAVQNLSLAKSTKILTYMIHKSNGVVLLFVGILFLFARYQNIVNLKPGLAQWEHILATVTHKTLLAMIVLMPLSGVLMALFSGKSLPFYGLFSIPSPFQKVQALALFFHEMHHFCAYLLYLSFFLHLLGTLKHVLAKEYQHLQILKFR